MNKSEKARLRHLKQYQDLTDDEFDDLMDRKSLGVAPSRAFEKRIEAKLEEFEEDYDLTDMKVNDKQTLRNLVQAIITLEDLEQAMYQVRQAGISDSNLMLQDKVTSQMSRIRGDISKMQDDLKITRKSRKADKEESALNFIQDMVKKAERTYEARMSKIFCPECNMLLGTTWFLWPNADNKLSFKCKRKLDTGETCKGRAVVSSKELMEKRGTNKPSILPESML
jgi:hypothetical protein